MQKFAIHKVPAEKWNEREVQGAYFTVFGKPASYKTVNVDFVLVLIYEGKAGGYIECVEGPDKTVYWKCGGGNQEHQGGTLVWEGYKFFCEWTFKHYNEVNLLVERTNTRMIRLSHQLGFKITGSQFVGNELLLHMSCLKNDYIQILGAAA